MILFFIIMMVLLSSLCRPRPFFGGWYYHRPHYMFGPMMRGPRMHRPMHHHHMGHGPRF